MTSESREALLRKIKARSEILWENNCQAPDVEAWLSNFDGSATGDVESERLHALHLLSAVSYFGMRELRVMLRALYRDHIRYPLIQRIRDSLNSTRDEESVHTAFAAELADTRFLGVGNPAESGTHLLYYFRQENSLPRTLFINQNELFTGGAGDPATTLAIPGLRRLVFIDDVCGSGDQAIRYSRTLLADIKRVSARDGVDVELLYVVLFGLSGGLDAARKGSAFDQVLAVNELDETYCTYSEDSRVMSQAPDFIDKAVSQSLAEAYGLKLWPGWPLGYKDGQLLLALHHNVPNNSLPILWYDEGDKAWIPAFPRYPKID